MDTVLNAVLERPRVRTASSLSSTQPWSRCTDAIEAKVVAVDLERHAVEFMFRFAPGFSSGQHRHTCESHFFVVSGRVVNSTYGIEYGPGDYYYQPDGDTHDEQFPEGAVVFGSYRGEQDTLVEFFDSDGKLCGDFKVSDFAALMV